MEEFAQRMGRVGAKGCSDVSGPLTFHMQSDHSGLLQTLLYRKSLLTSITGLHLHLNHCSLDLLVPVILQTLQGQDLTS